jgi:hypothetical protein
MAEGPVKAKNGASVTVIYFSGIFEDAPAADY